MTFTILRGHGDLCYELDLGADTGRCIRYRVGGWVADSLDLLLASSFVLSDGSVARSVGVNNN